MSPFFIMNWFELFFLKLGFSFAFAKFLPYLFLLFIGFFLAKWLLKLLKPKISKNWLQGLFFVSTFIQPFLFYFFFYPIYQGDLIEMSYKPSGVISPLPKEALVIIALPGCSFCSQSTQTMRSIRPFLCTKVIYWVLGSDESNLKAYQQLVGRGIHCELKPNIQEIIPLTQGSFPTYLQIKNGKIIKAWHNDTFGIKALEEMD